MEYYALFEPDHDAGGFVVTFPDFGYGVTQGDSKDEAYEMAQDLLAAMIGDLMAREKELPAPSRHRGRKYRLVALPALQAAKVELYRAFRDSGIRKAELAKRTGIAEPNIGRLFDLRHSSRLHQLESAFDALGKKLVLSVQDAA
ncbi:MAG: type II toxin-antitoxin system HicB family antitoxin [Bryobacterales bacterium]|nr:type II toxin-antitoxin system HicB family antitoxin [Bryobacterales bacterium]